MTWIEYKNMSFEKGDDGVWIHKDWALPGDFGDIYNKPASLDLQAKIEEAYQEKELDRQLAQKASQKYRGFNPLKVKDGVALDFTKPISKEDLKQPKVKESKPPPKLVKKSELRGAFNPFKDGLKL